MSDVQSIVAAVVVLGVGGCGAGLVGYSVHRAINAASFDRRTNTRANQDVG